MHGDYFDDSPLITPQPCDVVPPPRGRRNRRKPSLKDAFQELRDAGGSGWDNVADPQAFLLQERGEGDGKE